MVKKAHHSTNHRSRGVVAGAVSALSLLAVSTQAVNAEQLTVKTGDTIWGLAKQHGLSVSALEQANPTIKKLSDSVDLITVGQQLTLPTTQQDPHADLNADGSYTVKPGDTLSTIAEHYNITVSQLMAWNNLGANDSLYIGQQLSVTGPAASVASTVAVTPQVMTSAPVQQAPATSQASSAPVAPVSQAATTSTASLSQGVATSTVVTTSTEQAAAITNSSAVSSAAPAQASAVANSAVAATSNATTNVSVASATPQSSVATNQTNPGSAVNSTTTQQLTVNHSSNYANSYNAAMLYGQSFVQTAPATSQASAAQPTPVASQASSQTVTTPASQAAATQSTATQPAPASSTAQSTAPATQPSQQPATNASQDLQHGSVVSLATKIANSNSVPYVWGGESLSGMDCSGLVKYVYANAEGKQLPHYTGALENCVDQHPVSQAQPGDLLFWGNHGSTYHTAIYTGNNQYVAAAKPGTNVATYTISPYFNPSFAGTVK